MRVAIATAETETPLYFPSGVPLLDLSRHLLCELQALICRHGWQDG